MTPFSRFSVNMFLPVSMLCYLSLSIVASCKFIGYEVFVASLDSIEPADSLASFSLYLLRAALSLAFWRLRSVASSTKGAIRMPMTLNIFYSISSPLSQHILPTFHRMLFRKILDDGLFPNKFDFLLFFSYHLRKSFDWK